MRSLANVPVQLLDMGSYFIEKKLGLLFVQNRLLINTPSPRGFQHANRGIDIHVEIQKDWLQRYV